MLKQVIEREIRRSSLLFIVVTLTLLALVVELYLIQVEILIPISPVFRDPNFITRLFAEYTPLALSIIMLIWIKKDRLEDEKVKKVSTLAVALIALCFIVLTLIMLRGEDAYAMLTYPYALGPTIPSRVWTRVLFYSSLSLLLLTISVLLYGKKGLWVLVATAIIPAFYTFNNDMVVNATKLASLGFLYPIYSFILSFGKFETLVIGGLLNVFGVQSTVLVHTFPYRIFMGGSLYLVDLPCIGWEGVVGYSVIFLNFLVELVKENRMRVIWGIVGFFGTLGVNLLRLILIFAFGAIWGAPVAQIIHSHSGDIIFLGWMLCLLYLIYWVSKRMSKQSAGQPEQ